MAIREDRLANRRPLSACKAAAAPGITRRPRVGERLRYEGDWGPRHCTVREVDGNLCWVVFDGYEKSEPFIWNFPRDGAMNCLFAHEADA